MFGRFFHVFAEKTSRALGTPYAFALALLAVVAWALLGPAFHYGDTWQLTINTGTTIITFLMVFLIQNTQNREARATELKLDELLRSMKEARTSMVNVDQLSDDELAALEKEFRRLGKGDVAQSVQEHAAER
jgi:low affinity Fe/Cu permease